jgi:uncharacterized membrane protein
MDQPFDSPIAKQIPVAEIARIPLLRPFEWLAAGWRDLRSSPLVSIGYGVFFALMGGMILNMVARWPYLITVAVSGFFLVGPILAVGLYEISRRREAGGERAGIRDLFEGVRRNAQSLFYMAVLLVLIAIAWERLSAILFALLYGGVSPDPLHFLRDVFLSGNYLGFLVAYLATGGMVAAVVFAISAVSIPMLMDREVDTVTAVVTSLQAVRTNLLPMAVWAALIVALTALGFATGLVGLTVIMPLLGHATWHCYRDVVR